MKKNTFSVIVETVFMYNHQIKLVNCVVKIIQSLTSFLIVGSMTAISMLKFPDLIMDLWISPCNSFSFCFVYVQVCLVSECTFKMIIFLVIVTFISVIKSIPSNIKILLILIIFFLTYLFLYSYFQHSCKYILLLCLFR